jgi:hypothetical protein
VRAVLKANEYAARWRDRFAATSYNVIGRIDIRRYYRIGVWGDPTPLANGKPNKGAPEQELVERYLDLGQNPVDAESSAAFTQLDHWRTLTNRTTSRVQTSILQAYAIGTIGLNQGLNLLQQLGKTPAEAQILMGTVDLQVDSRAVQRGIAAATSAVFSGAMSIQEGENQLIAMGVQPTRITSYIRQWTAQLQGRRKELSASQVLAYLVDGVIGVAEAFRRLTNLGYSQDAVRHQLRSAWAKWWEKNQRRGGQAPPPPAGDPDGWGGAWGGGADSALGGLTKADIKAAWLVDLYTDQQAGERLTRLGLTAEAAATVLETWRRQGASP